MFKVGDVVYWLRSGHLFCNQKCGEVIQTHDDSICVEDLSWLPNRDFRLATEVEKAWFLRKKNGKEIWGDSDEFGGTSLNLGFKNSITFYEDRFCCGRLDAGAFKFSDKDGDTAFPQLIERLFGCGRRGRKGVINATTNRTQNKVTEALLRKGFNIRSVFKNPNTYNDVYELEHRTFNGEVNVENKFERLL